MKYFKLIVFGVIFLPFFASAQSGVSIQIGPMVAFSPDNNITESGKLHYGWASGLDVRFMGDDMYFMVGGQYQALSLMSTQSPEIFNNDWTILTGRCGLGGTLLRLSNNSTIRAKALVSFNFNFDAPSGALNKPDYSNLNDSFLGAVAGLGLTRGIFDFDVEYQHGFINAYNLRPNSTFNTIALLVGFNF